jgi:fluoroacetyl-CoA thioesterase
MKKIFQPGDQKVHRFKVAASDLATFKGKILHPVCSTYKLGQEMEWSSRLFMLDIIGDEEEGLGTMLHIDHLGPAYEEEEVTVTATWSSFEQNVLKCDIEVRVGDRLIARGATGQKLILKERLKEIIKPKK